MESLEEYPYQVQAVVDLAKNFSSDHFRYAIKQCREVIAKTVAEDNRSDQQIARVHILRYLDIQLARAVRWIEDEADLMALVLRSQIELRAWAEFISRGPDEATQFLHEADIDARELHEKMEKAYPDEIQPLSEEIPGKRVRFTRSNDREDADFILCSKSLLSKTALSASRPHWQRS